MTMKRAALAGWMTALLLTTVAVAGVSGATFTVDSTGDQADATPGDGVCAGSGGCTLRAAIEEANAFAGADVIAFDIPGKGVHKIAPLSPLPQITGAVTIDGYTQPGAAPNISPTSAGINAVLMIELSGESAGTGADGIRIVGGGSTVRGLVVNRFTDDGIALNDGDGNVIVGNFIGTDPTGTIDLGNIGDGFAVDTLNVRFISHSNRIGGTDPADRNLISGNQDNGINLFFSNGNIVQGNIVGLAADGETDLGNNEAGVVSNFGANTIGGADAAARNIVSGNRTIGVLLQGGNGDANVVQGNVIGTDVSGMIGVGNGTDGILLNVRSGDIVGGTGAGEGNVISGNGGNGISIGNSDGIRIDGNLIGTGADGVTPVGNGESGIFFIANGAGCRIGIDAPNVIAHNGGGGLTNASGSGNTIRRNSIHSNAGPGIDLGDDGVTPNDAGDADTGPNELQNFPIVRAAANGTTVVMGSLHSAAETTFTIDLYSNAAADGQGEIHLGSATVTTDAAGDAAFSLTPAVELPLGRFVTATATDPAGNTSEFSAAAQVLPPSAAPVFVAGRVTDARGRAIGGATLTLITSDGSERRVRTGSFGIYRFDALEAGESYMLSVRARGRVFSVSSLLLSPTDNIADADFIADP